MSLLSVSFQGAPVFTPAALVNKAGALSVKSMVKENMNENQFEKFFDKRYHFSPKGVLQDTRNRATSAQAIYASYIKWLDEADREDDSSKSDVEEWITKHAPSKEDKGTEQEQMPPKEFIENWLKEHSGEWYISPAWKEIKYTKLGVSTYKDLESIRVAIMTDIYNSNNHYSVDAIKCTLQSMCMNGYQRGLATVVESIKYEEKFVSAGERWLKAIYDYFKPKESYDIFSTLMKHWAWQVKRKMNDRPVKYHIWLNFFGAAGLGKTTALNKISSPINDFTSTTSISKLFDDTKEIKRLTENFILIFDEMAVNVESEASGGRLTVDQKAILKSIITGDKMDARIYGTQEQAKRKITFSCISSANEHLYDVIYDETTMRRFFDFNCTGVRPKSFDYINNYLDHSIYFWKSIDENSDDGYFTPDNDIGRQIIQIQSMYYPTKTTTKMWADSVNLRPGQTKVESAFRFYSNWCKETGNKGKALQYFVRDIQHILPGCASPNGKIYVDFDSTDNVRDIEESLLVNQHAKEKNNTDDTSVLF